MESLINLYPKTAEEKLFFAESYIAELIEKNKILAMENGYLKSEMDELRHEMKQDNIGALILKQENQVRLIKELNEKLRKVKKDNENLIIKVAQLQLSSNFVL
jgi:hypothetical protein